MKVLVTGGGGFLGGAIVRELLKRGDQVRSYSRGAYPELEKLGVEQPQGDLTMPHRLAEAAAGCDVVFHVAAKVGLWGPYDEFYKTNVVGTRNVVSACERAGVRRLVFTGSPSVVFDGRDVEGWDESTPYAEAFDGHYSRTKATSEEIALSAASDKLAVVSLRPHLVWGPGDNHIAPRLIAQRRAGKLRRIGGFDKLVDVTYIDDAARAHVLAATRLAVDPNISGRAYFLSQGDPRPLWEIVNMILAAADLPPVEESVPLWKAKAGAYACETAWKLLRLKGEPPVTRFLVKNLTTAHWFDISAAKRDLEWSPQVSIEEGMRRLRASLQQAGGVPQCKAGPDGTTDRKFSRQD